MIAETENNPQAENNGRNSRESELNFRRASMQCIEKRENEMEVP